MESRQPQLTKRPASRSNSWGTGHCWRLGTGTASAEPHRRRSALSLLLGLSGMAVRIWSLSSPSTSLQDDRDIVFVKEHAGGKVLSLRSGGPS